MASQRRCDACKLHTSTCATSRSYAAEPELPFTDSWHERSLPLRRCHHAPEVVRGKVRESRCSDRRMLMRSTSSKEVTRERQLLADCSAADSQLRSCGQDGSFRSAEISWVLRFGGRTPAPCAHGQIATVTPLRLSTSSSFGTSGGPGGISASTAINI